MSLAQSLQQVADACENVRNNVTDISDETPYTFKKITERGMATFRFTQVVVIDGQEFEVTVRPVVPVKA